MKSSRCITVIFFLCLLLIQSNYSIAQDNDRSVDSLNPNKANIYKAFVFTSVYYGSSLFVLSKTWYNDRERVPFHFYNDNKGYLQTDKFRHSFGAYVYSYVGYHFLLNSGFTRKDALSFGSTLGLILQIPIEIMDGLYEGYGFSWGDMATNTMGWLFHMQLDIASIY